jgi:S1-C subfamily serine protease
LDLTSFTQEEEMKLGKLLIGLVAVIALLILGGVAGGAIVYATNAAASDQGAAEAVAESVQPQDDGQADSERGIVLSAVDPDGPAAQAGVVRGDILLELDGEAVDDALQLRRQLAAYEVGDDVVLRVLHGDDERTLTATLGERVGGAYLGVTPCGGLTGLGTMTVTQELWAGAQIVDVVADSPAEAAGLQEGDRILAVDGEEVGPGESLTELITAHAPGDTVTLEVARADEDNLELEIQLAEHPEQEGVAYLGVEYLTLPRLQGFEGEALPFDRPFFRAFPFGEDGAPGGSFSLPPDAEGQAGAIIREVTPDSPAEAAGLQQGDVVTMIDGEPVQAPQDLVDAVTARTPGDTISLTVISPEEEEREVEVTLADNPEQEGQAYLGVRIGGFWRSFRFDGAPNLRGGQPLEQFLDQLPFDFGQGGELQFDWGSQPHLRWGPSNPDVTGSPRSLIQTPCCTGEQTL